MTPEERQQFLSLVSRYVRPGAGSGPLTLRERTQAHGSPDLHVLAARVEFVIVGGLATRLYMPERMTLDTDILVRLSDLPHVETALRDAGCTKQGPLAIGGSTWRLPDGRNLDVVALHEPWIEEALNMPVKAADGLPYIALPYLVLMKLASGRMQDLADIGRMLGGAEPAGMDEVRRIMVRYRPRDLEDVENMRRIGQLEYGEPHTP
jgi:hypothetical protein